MRGTLEVSDNALLADGIIPAHAGNTHAQAAFAQPSRDHPRACGEHLLPVRRASAVLGSSPRMRGTHNQRQDIPDQLRIIPAHAGNTRQGYGNLLALRDHPRACGEHSSVGTKGVRALGSSPRMRGTRCGVGYA